MTEKITHEEIDMTVAQIPGELIARLPDSTEKRSAQRCLGQAAIYAHECVEKARAQAKGEDR